MYSASYGYEEQFMKKYFNMLRCFKGSSTLIITTVAAFMAGSIALSTAKISSSVFSGTNSNRIAVQAQEYALTSAEALRARAYGDITAISRRQIANTDNYFEEIIVGAETAYKVRIIFMRRIFLLHCIHKYKG